MSKKKSGGKSGKKPSSFGLEREGGKKISQPGTEFFHKMHETRRHRSGGRPRKSG